MEIYKKCQRLPTIIKSEDVNGVAISSSNGVNGSSLPLMLFSNSKEQISSLCDKVFYISDIHIGHKISSHFKQKASNEKIKQYIKSMAVGLFDRELSDAIVNHQSPIVIFGGDISTYFELSEIFYTEFIAYWIRLEDQSAHTYKSNRYIYAILGNHELWDFETVSEACKAYKKLFKRLGICFLHNNATWLGRNILPFKLQDFATSNRSSNTADENYRDGIMGYSHDVLMVGGIGFAGYNDYFNADRGIYRGTLNRKQEVAETRKWEKVYANAVAFAKETNRVLIVLSHNPISDWKKDRLADPGCIYFTGHSHCNYLYHDDEMATYIFANNQIGYRSSNVQFRNTYIYNRLNPFAGYCDGYHEITSEEYLDFYDYMDEYIGGNGTVDYHIKKNDGRFYMIKHSGYYGFFLTTAKGTYICIGGNIKKISQHPNIEQVNSDFLCMIKQYLQALSPYRNAQECISNFVKSFGGSGKIHGCIIDIDFYNHIMLNPFDGTLTYYYSLFFGEMEIYDNLLSLLEDNNKELANCYKKQLDSGEQSLIISSQVSLKHEIVQIDIKNSLYVVSNKMNQLQRLFDKGILRDWNENLLLSQEPTDSLLSE